ncbi:MAG: PIN domain-containing protein [Spirochaetes bacterium]|nr:PIN domain-containing protein [Spirochaetota bacterium]
MDKPRFLFDSNIVIGILNGALNLEEFLDAFPDCEAYINPIIEIEVLAKADMSKEEEAEARALLSKFMRAEIDESACEAAQHLRYAIQIRRAKELRLPDALIAASCISINATLLSNDPHLRDYKRPGYKAMAVPEHRP